MKADTNESHEPILIHPQRTRFHHVRITADPANPRSVDIVEGLLTRCGLCRCASSSEDGTSVWDIIVPEELLDLALEGIAVTIPVGVELFPNEDGRFYYVTEDEACPLLGYAEEVAQCWDGPDLDGFEGEITQAIRGKIESEMMSREWPAGDKGEKKFAEVEDAVWSQVAPLQWAEEDVEDAVREAYERIVGKEEPKGD